MRLRLFRTALLVVLLVFGVGCNQQKAPAPDPNIIETKLADGRVLHYTKQQLAEAQSIIIVVSAEPGAVVTSTNLASTKVEPAKPKPEEAEPAAQHAHAHGGWLIQIGAFDGEEEARQHLSEAQLKASTALAAADPFTERVQKGDKALYRARFAGFDKETAEVACRQLKRSHFECVALKD